MAKKNGDGIVKVDKKSIKYFLLTQYVGLIAMCVVLINVSIRGTNLCTVLFCLGIIFLLIINIMHLQQQEKKR